MLPEKRAALLAAAVEPPISVEWLRFGRGTMDVPAPGPVAPPAVASAGLPADVELAFYDAIATGEFAAEDGVAARGIVAAGREWIPRGRAEATRAIGRLLEAVAQVRAAGRAVTADSILWSVLATIPPSAATKAA